MKPTQLSPAFAENLGMDVQEMNDTNKVTIVRRRVVYEEVVVTKDEFNKINELIEDDDEYTFHQLEMEDINFPDFTDEETRYIAFSGDVTSFTDDAIFFADYQGKFWTEAYYPIELAS